ncbi:hypothetical protein P5F77_08235 [Caldifermentibacillus hisashii]|jgi:hypothetical protein|uniref:hypothetical protein n=1 Tax=Bacillaceae TaxID=186817 RepID=UPI0020426052|nr:hypothetical protein [Caldibacillus thermoamylovorans]MCM3799783.1 hypothetical protein [Caldibacillus thermoamylovorans]MDL0421335.1 hypothetical protein [Caldibacillus thermoamylovorans]
MDKISFLQDFIKQCDEVLTNHDSREAEELTEIIVEIFQNEINNIQYGLDSYSGLGLYDNTPPNYLGDIKKLKMKLLNYMHNLNRQDQIAERELEKLKLQSNVSAVFNNTNSNVNETNISLNVSISTHINNCIQLTEDDKNLTSKEKQMIQELLTSLQEELIKKNKTGAKETIKSIVTFLLNKGTDVLISLLPSIGSLSNLLRQL